MLVVILGNTGGTVGMVDARMRGGGGGSEGPYHVAVHGIELGWTKNHLDVGVARA